MANYEGACIGGVADGKWIKKDKPNIRVEMRRALRPGFEGEPEILEHTDYKFLLLLGTSNAEIGVWTPQDVTIEQVVTRLVKCYNPRTGLIGVPAANPLTLKG